MTSSSSLYGTVTTQNTSSGNSTSLYGEAGTPIPDSSGNVVVRGDLYVLSGNILTTANTGNIFPQNATTVNLGLAATAVNIGAGTGTTTINNDLVINGTFTAPSADFGNITIAVADDNTITTTTGNLKLTSATGDLELNAGTGILYPESNNRINRPSVQSTNGNSSGFRVLAPNATTSAQSNLTVFGSNDVNNGEFITVQASGSTTAPFTIRTGKYTAGVLGTSGEEINFIDGSTTYASINPAGPTNPLDLATKAYVDSQELNTTYTIDASSTTGGANFNLVGSDATTDTIKFAQGTGITVSRTDANTITMTNAGVTSITGTTNQVIASGSTGAVTLSLPQSINTTANPTFGGATLGAVKVGITTDNTIDTTSGNLVIAPATGIITVSAPTTVQWAEANDRTKRFTFQSSSGNSTGTRVLAPNATTSATANMGVFATNDINNGEFLTIRASGSTTAPYTILTGKYTGGVLGSSGQSVNFIDNTTTYASVNPSGPTVGTDLVTKTYFDTNIPNPSELVNGSYTFTLNADGTVTTPSKISAPGPLTLQGGALDPTTVVVDDVSLVATFDETLPGGDSAILTATNGSLTWAHTAGAMVMGSEDGTWSLNADGTTSFPNYTFPYADGSANQVLKTNGSGVLAWYSPSDLNTTYTIDASSTTGGANLNLVGSDASTDTIKFASGTGITVAQTDANTITVNSTITQYTDADARNSISATGDISYNSTTGVISYTAPTAPVTSVNTQTGAVVLDTDDISEGATNLYFTDARSRSAISAGTGISYNSTTGVITNDGVTSAVAGTHITVSGATGAVTIGTDATNANTASTIVARDSNGDFSAGTITANFTNGDRVLGALTATPSTTYVFAPPVIAITDNNGLDAASSYSSALGNGAQQQLTHYFADTFAGTNTTSAINFRTANGNSETTGTIPWTGVAPTAMSASLSNNVLGTVNYSGYATTGFTNTIASQYQGGGRNANHNLQIQGIATETLVDSTLTISGATITAVSRVSAALASVAVTGTKGQISFTATTPAQGNAIVVTGTNSGTSTGISAGTYYITFTGSTSTATLSATPNGAPITTTPGTTTGLTFTRQFITVTYSAQTYIPFGLNALVTISGFNNVTSGTYACQGTSTTTSVVIGAPSSGAPTLSGSQSVSCPTVTNAGSAMRVRAFPLAKPMNSGNRVEIINHSPETATYKSDQYNFQGGSNAFNYLTANAAAVTAQGTLVVKDLTGATTYLTVDATKAAFTRPVGLAVYTAAALTAITGAVGYTAAVSNSPTVGGRLAFWDTTNSRWSYVSDNTAV